MPDRARPATAVPSSTPELRVHGLANLRIADASVLPTVPHANTNLAAILVGEIAARHIAGLPLDAESSVPSSPAAVG